MIGKLAWRNVWRNKLRSLVVVIALVVGLFGVIFVAAMSQGMVNKMVETAIENEISDIQVHQSSYLISEELRDVFPIDKVQPIVGAEDDKLDAYTYRIKVDAMAASANSVQQVTLVGVDPRSEANVSAISRELIDGQYFGTETRMKEIILGEKLVELLELRLGSKVVLSFADANSDINYESFKIVGIYKTNSSEFDKMMAHVLHDDLAPVLKLGDGNYHELAIRCSAENIDGVSSRMQVALDGYAVRKWSEVNPSLEAMQGMMAISTFIMVMIVLIALIFGLINTMLMVVMERRKELGMLRALGLTNAKIARMIIFETVLLGLIGGAIGNIVSYLAIAWFGDRGIEFKSAAEGLESFGVGSTLYPALAPSTYLIITLLVLLTALFASIFPVRRALKQDIAATIRN